MKKHLDIDIDFDNKKFLKRYLPSGIIIFLILLGLFWSTFISKYGNNCTSSDVSYFLSEENKNITIGLINNVLVNIENEKYKDLKPLFADELGDINTLKKGFKEISDMLPEQSIENITIVGVDYQTSVNENYTIEQISTISEVNYPYSDFVTKLTYYKAGNEIKIADLRVAPKKQLTTMFQSSFSQASFNGYLAIMLTLLVLATILYALILCINTDFAKKKWLWIIFIMIGFCGINLDWSTQSYYIELINIRLFGAGWFKANCFSPLILSFSIPVGAIIFLVKYYQGSFKQVEKKTTDDKLDSSK